MLITHVKPTELWGKKVYDTNGHFLGQVVAIGSRRGVVRKVVIKRVQDDLPMSLVPPADTRVDADIVTLAAMTLAGQPRLRLVH
jgi:sporulation protein YlmC with PRC-barrel domain